MCEGCPMSGPDNATVDAVNTGASIAAKMLLAIAKTGEHNGVFEGAELEEAAQAILKLHTRLQELERRMNAAEFADLSGE
jgi:ATP phosphoribosyltransferase